MKAALSVLVTGLAAVPLGAQGTGVDAEGRSPSWVEKGLETVNPAASAANDLWSGASDAIRESKRVTAGQISLDEGNRAVRKAIASEYNGVQKAAQGWVKFADKLHLGALTTIADLGGTLGGHVAEGDYRAVPGIVADTAAKGAVTAGGAWAGATAGAAAGSFFGPVGTLAGGAIGAGLGTLGLSLGYDATSGALERNGYGNVRSFVDSLFAETELSPAEARRHDERNAAVQQQHEEQARRLGIGSSQGDREVELVDPGAEPPRILSPSAPPRDASIPVIPDDCTIELSLWGKSSPEHKWHATFTVNGDTVTGHGEYTYPATGGADYRRSALRTVNEFTGTKRDNVITGTSRGGLQRAHQESWGVSGGKSWRCTYEWWTNDTVEEEWTFLLGGSARLRSKGTMTSTNTYSGDCSPHSGSETHTQSIGTDNDPSIVITWKIR